MKASHLIPDLMKKTPLTRFPASQTREHRLSAKRKSPTSQSISLLSQQRFLKFLRDQSHIPRMTLLTMSAMTAAISKSPLHSIVLGGGAGPCFWCEGRCCCWRWWTRRRFEWCKWQRRLWRIFSFVAGVHEEPKERITRQEKQTLKHAWNGIGSYYKWSSITMTWCAKSATRNSALNTGVIV